jgi:predicted LPLAT superfamily acyltransferase
MDESRKIRARRRGNQLGFWFFGTSLRLFDLRGAYGLLYIVCVHYLLFDRPAVRAALAYLRRRFPEHRPWRLAWDVYMLFVSQGRNLIDRYALISEAVTFRTRIEGEAELRHLLDNPKGLVLVTAHVGNWQAIMNYLARFRRKVNLVMRPEDNPAVQEALRIGESKQEVRIISPESHLGGVVEIMNALKRGEIVSLMGDRSYGFNPVEVSFLGHRAKFASGAFHIAALAECPVVVLLSAKTGVREYGLKLASISHPLYQGATPKREQLQGWVQGFAKTLEEYVRDYPEQCFLFHNVWEGAATPS